MFDSCCLVKSWDHFIDVQKSVIERNGNLGLMYLHILLQCDVLMHFKFGNSPFISISKCLQTTSLPPTQDGNPIYTPSVSIPESPSCLGGRKMSLLITEINNGMSTKYEEHCEALRMTQGSSVRHLTWVVWELNKKNHQILTNELWLWLIYCFHIEPHPRMMLALVILNTGHAYFTFLIKDCRCSISYIFRSLFPMEQPCNIS